MEEFNKKIKVDDYKNVIYNISPGYHCIHTIIATDTKDIKKNIRFSRWDDYSFKSWYSMKYEDYELLKNELHIFEKNHLLYLPLLHLLNGEKELIIDDDEVKELNEKYMKIFFDGENINIDFVNNLDKNPFFDRFSVFIKNIGFDIRSKIDCLELDTKERLYFFFNEVLDLFKEEYHQMTIEEYLLNNNQLSLEESKKYVKKLIK